MENCGLTYKGNWFKGNLHSHTTNSDGTLTPEQTVKAYAQAGYSFMALTDHDVYTDYREQLNTKDFIVLPGLEASAVLVDENYKIATKVHHINAILGTCRMQAQASLPMFHHMENYESKFFINNWEGLNVAQEIIDDLNNRGMLTTYNHPIWSRVEESEFVGLNDIWAFEIFNYGTELESGTGYGDMHWDMILRKGKHLCAFASDDNHNLPELDDAFGGYIVVSADELSHEAIITELIAGNYYSSSGAEIYQWGVKEGKAFVECSNAENITFYCGNQINDGRTVFSLNKEDGICTAEYELKGHEEYIRVVCVDINGKKAWSNPIWIKECANVSV